MKRLLHGLVAVNTSAKADVTRTREGRLATAGRADQRSHYERGQTSRSAHHLETGRKALYVNCAHTARFVGMIEEESALPLLLLLLQRKCGLKPALTHVDAGASFRTGPPYR